MRQWMAIGAAALILAGCARGDRAVPAGPIAIEADSIRLETGPCFGRCPVYAVTVRPDGTGIFEGKRFTAVEGERAFKLSKVEYDAFAAKLAPYRPESGVKRIVPGEKECGNVATDMPSIDITWTRAIGDSQSLSYYFGCDWNGNRSMADALGHAAEALPIEDLIGERP